MSKTIDQKVVEMQFDNQQFERNVSSSLSTLDKLKKALNFDGASKSLNGLEEASKKVTFTSLSDALGTVSVSFSALQTVADTVFRRMTNAAIDTAMKIESALTNSIIQGGWNRARNIEKAKFMLEGLKVGWEEISADIDYGVKDTAYGLDAAANVAAQLVASGVEFGEQSDQMRKALRGISGVAAMTDSTYEDIGHVFTTVAGQGKLMTMQMRQLELRGLNIAAIIGEQLGKTEAEVREMVTQGEINFEIFSSAMDSAFGEHAKAANKTFSGAMSNVRAALARVGAEVATPLIQNSIPVLNAIRIQINNIKKALDPFYKKAKEIIEVLSERWTHLIENADLSWIPNFFNNLDFSGIVPVLNTIRNGFKSLSKILEPVKKAFRSIFPKNLPHQIDVISNGAQSLKKGFEGVTALFDAGNDNGSSGLRKFLDDLENIVGKFKITEERSKKLEDIFKGLFSIIDIGRQAFESLGKFIDPISTVLARVFDFILDKGAIVGRWLQNLNNNLKKNNTFSNFADLVIDYVGRMHDKIKTFIDLVKDSTIFKGLIDGISTFIESVKSKFSYPGFEGFSGFLDKLKDRLSGVIEFLSKVKDSIFTFFEAIWNKLKEIRIIDILSGIWNVFKTIVSEIGGLLGSILDTIASGNFDGFFDLVNSIMTVLIDSGLYEFIKSLSSRSGGIGKIANNVSGFFTTLTDTLTSFSDNMKKFVDSKILMNIAKAIGILAISLVVLASIDSEKLNSAIGGITMLFIDLFGSMKFLNGAGSFDKTLKFAATSMIGVSIAVLLLSSALKRISDLRPEELVTGLAGVSAILFEVVGVIKLLKNTSGGLDLKSAAGLIFVGYTVKILSDVAKDLGSLDLNTLLQGIGGLLLILGELGVFMVGLSQFGNGLNFSSAAGIVLVAASLKIIATVVSDLGSIDYKAFEQGMFGIAGSLLGIMALMAVIGRMDNTKVFSAGAGIALVGVALKAIASAAKDFASMSWDEFQIAATGLGVSLAAVVAALKLLDNPKALAGAGAVAIVSVGLIGIAAAMKMLSSMDTGGALVAAVALAGSLTVITIALLTLANPKALIGAAAITIVSASLLVLAPALLALSTISWGGLAKGLIALAGALTIFLVAAAVAEAVLPGILGLSAAFTLIGVGTLAFGAGLIAIGAGMTAIATGFQAMLAIIPNLAKMVGDFLTSIFRGFESAVPALLSALREILLASIALIIEVAPELVKMLLVLVDETLKQLVEHIPSIVSSIFDLLIGIINSLADKIPELISAAFNLFGAFFEGIVDAIKGIDTERLLKMIEGVGILSVIIVALSAITPMIPAAMIGILGVGAIIAEMALVLAAVGALGQIPGLKWFISEGGEVLGLIGNAIGQFVGGIIGGIAEGITNSFPNIATNLSTFMTNLEPFIEGANKIDASSLDGVGRLVEIILLLTAANILDRLTSWFTGGRSSLADFGKELADFGPYFADYYESVKGIDGDVITASSNAAKALSEMAQNLPRHGGIWADIAGDNSLSQFAEELKAFGPDFAAYAASVEGINAETVVASANAAKSMSELAANLPNSGGILAVFTGDNTLSSFAEELKAFGPAFAEYAASVTGIDPNVVVNSANAAKALVELANGLPNSGGVISWFTGDNNIESFGRNLVSFGEDLSSYSDLVANIKTYEMQSTTTVSMKLVDFATYVADKDTSTLTSFSYSITDFGIGLLNYWNNISGINTYKLGSVTSELNNLVAMAKGMKDVDTGKMTSFSSSLTDLGNFGVDNFISAFQNAGSRIERTAKEFLDKFISGSSSKKEDVKRTYTHIIDDVLSALYNKQPVFKTYGQTTMGEFVSGLSSNSNLAVNNFGSLMSDLLQKIRDFSVSFKSAGSALIENLNSGMSDPNQTVSVKNAAISLANSAINAVKGLYDDMWDAGYYLSSGLWNGINNQTTRTNAYNAGYAVASSAKDGSRVALRENSPSKEGEEIGYYYVVGFINELYRMTGASFSAGKGIGDSAKNGLQKAIDSASRYISDESMQPVVKPVLDLSNIQNGKKLFSRMVGDYDGNLFTDSVGMVSSISSSFRSMNDNNVANAIDKLGKDISGIKENSNNITNNFNVTSNNPEQFANEVSRILARQTQRIEASWG